MTGGSEEGNPGSMSEKCNLHQPKDMSTISMGANVTSRGRLGGQRSKNRNNEFRKEK